MLSEEEKAVYDRQLRVWGVDNQLKLRETTVLIVNFDLFTGELAKNCILSGMNVDIYDKTVITRNDCNFYIRHSEIGQKTNTTAASRLQGLNKLVKVQATETTQGTYDCIAATGDLQGALELSQDHPTTPCYYFISSGEQCAALSTNGEHSLSSLLSSIPAFLRVARKRPTLPFYEFLARLYVAYSPTESLELYPGVVALVRSPLFAPSVTITSAVVSQNISSCIFRTGHPFQVFFFDSSLSLGLTEDLITCTLPVACNAPESYIEF